MTGPGLAKGREIVPLASPHGRPVPPVFVLVGAEVVIRTTEIVAVLDQETVRAAATREFLGFCRRKGLVEDLTGGSAAKAVVVCRRRVLLSPFSEATLRRRLSG